jgi:transglutaminase-like putative cysteine protease/predicted esterase
MKTRAFLIPVLAGLLLSLCPNASAQAAGKWWNDDVEKQLAAAGTNRAEITKALTTIAEPRRQSMEFLVQYMPVIDLTTLSADYLLQNVTLACDAWDKAPWHDKVDRELFLNDVLPYASMSETRDAWRKRLMALCAPVVADCKTPGEAALRINEKFEALFKVKYNTARKKPDQSPLESMEQGMATCSGLSIILVDACRSVGVPARIAGTPMWTNMRGNHTWVEIWDAGGWHYVGAAEPDKNGYDRGWFTRDASLARKDIPEHSIYATSYKRTGLVFPMVWLPDDKSVNGVNVTERYVAKVPAPEEAIGRLLVNVVDALGKRIVSELTVVDVEAPTLVYHDQSRGDTADMNDFAAFKVVPKRRYHITAKKDAGVAEMDAGLPDATERVVTLMIGASVLPAQTKAPAAARIKSALSTREEAALKAELTRYFLADAMTRENWTFSRKFEKMLCNDEPAVRRIAWDAYKSAPVHTNLKADYDAHVVKFQKYESPYTVKTVGTRPTNGWPLFIAMHGGGNAPKSLNDSQWKHMQIYYKDHPEVGGYLYLALRAPNDTWNGFYDVYVYPLIDNLILQFRLFADIDPDKVFIMGYSHGGYGAYAIGPKMPDRFAAIHASAGAGSDGETTAKTLRTTPFTAMVGELDKAYGRYDRNVSFKKEIEKLRGNRTDIYPVTVTIVSGNGHTGLPDRDKIPTMYPAVRNPLPCEMDWMMTDSVIQDFFWLHVPTPSKQQEILASFEKNRFVVTANEKATNIVVHMDSRMVDFTKPVDIELNGSTTSRKLVPSLKTFCETLARRGDPAYAFSASLKIAKDASGVLKVVNPDK